jgi:lipoate-protein ligase A
MTFDPWKQRAINDGLHKLKNKLSITDSVDTSIDDIKKLSGIGQKAQQDGSNPSITAMEKSRIMKEKNIRPGTPEWFQLWFSLPYLTGEKPLDK